MREGTFLCALGLLHSPAVSLCGKMGTVMYGKGFKIHES